MKHSISRPATTAEVRAATLAAVYPSFDTVSASQGFPPDGFTISSGFVLVPMPGLWRFHLAAVIDGAAGVTSTVFRLMRTNSTNSPGSTEFEQNDNVPVGVGELHTVNVDRIVYVSPSKAFYFVWSAKGGTPGLLSSSRLDVVWQGPAGPSVIG